MKTVHQYLVKVEIDHTDPVPDVQLRRMSRSLVAPGQHKVGGAGSIGANDKVVGYRYQIKSARPVPCSTDKATT